MKIGIGILCWNNFEETKNLLSFIGEEMNENDNYFLYIVDNGSSEEQIFFLENFECEKLKKYKFISNGANLGISISKNMFIEEMVNDKCDLVFMFDNDVIPIKNSFKAMIEYMRENPYVGCLGQHIDYYTTDMNKFLISCKNIDKIEDNKIEKNTKSGCGAFRAWTHYSVFPINVFERGIRFDESGPFGHPGYGFDDDDLGMQIHKNGYEIHCFKEECFHSINSSVPQLKKDNILNYDERKEYFKKKWGDLKNGK